MLFPNYYSSKKFFFFFQNQDFDNISGFTNTGISVVQVSEGQENREFLAPKRKKSEWWNDPRFWGNPITILCFCCLGLCTGQLVRCCCCDGGRCCADCDGQFGSVNGRRRKCRDQAVTGFGGPGLSNTGLHTRSSEEDNEYYHKYGRTRKSPLP